jgi:hypothetical protein
MGLLKMGMEVATEGALSLYALDTVLSLCSFNSLETRNGLNVARCSVFCYENEQMNKDLIKQAVLPRSRTINGNCQRT